MTGYLSSSSLLDLSHSQAAGLFEPDGYPWLVLPRIAAFLENLLAAPPEGYRLLSKGILVGEGTLISSRAELAGPALIGPGCEIRPGAYLRGNVVLGSSCVVGNSTELKNCILFDSAQAPHFNYVGDSILGYKSHIGAGVILSNFKSDGSMVAVRGEGFSIPTGLRKFGAILGDHVELGCNSVCNPGTVIGRCSTAYPLSLVRGVVPARVIIKADGRAWPKEEE